MNWIASNETKNIEIPEHLQKEFKVVKPIDGYRTRGHLFTRTTSKGTSKRRNRNIRHCEFWTFKMKTYVNFYN